MAFHSLSLLYFPLLHFLYSRIFSAPFAAEQVPEAPRWQKTGVSLIHHARNVAKWTRAGFAI